MLTKKITSPETEMKQANWLRQLLGLRKDGLLSSIFGGNEKVISSENLINYIIQAGFAKDYNEAKAFIPEIDGMRFYCNNEISHSLRLVKVKGEKAYEVSSYIG